MEVYLYSRCNFSSTGAAEFFSKMLKRSPETPVSVDAVEKKYRPLFDVLYPLEFTDDLSCEAKSVTCEWLLGDYETPQGIIRALNKLPRMKSFHIIDDDSEMEPYLVKRVGSELKEFDEWDDIAIREWNYNELFVKLS